MELIARIALLLFVVALRELNVVIGLGMKSDKRVVCFYSSCSGGGRSGLGPGALMSPRDLDPGLCSHLVYGYAGLTDADQLSPFDQFCVKDKAGFSKFVSLKSFNKELQTMVAVGKGLSSRRLSEISDDPARRTKFAKNVLMFLRVNRLNGINLSWQYPRAEDKENYVLLLKALREEFEREKSMTGRPNLILSMEVPHTMPNINDGFDIPSLTKYLDFVNVFMTSYQYHAEVEMNPHSPIIRVTGQFNFENEAQYHVDYTAKYFLSLGVPREKLVLGVPTQGGTLVVTPPTPANTDQIDVRLGEGDLPVEADIKFEELEGSLPYYEICSMLQTEGWQVVNPALAAENPFSYLRNFSINYDNPNSIKLKARYVAEEDLGGLMFWYINNDDFRGVCQMNRFPLVQAAKQALAKTKFGNAYRDEVTPSTSPEYQSITETGNSVLEREVPTKSAEEWKQFSTDDRKLLEDLVMLVKKLGGVSVLEKLLLSVKNTMSNSEKTVFPSSLSQKRTYSSNGYGPEVTSLTVTSAPLFLRKAPTPIVFSNFTINIDSLNIDAGSLGDT